MALTQGAGVDVAIEAVGLSATFDICQAIIAPGGRIANVGVHGKSVELHLERLWASNITLTTRLVDAGTTQCCSGWFSRDASTQRNSLATDSICRKS